MKHSKREVTEQMWPFQTSAKAVTKQSHEKPAYTATIIAQNQPYHPNSFRLWFSSASFDALKLTPF